MTSLLSRLAVHPASRALSSRLASAKAREAAAITEADVDQMGHQGHLKADSPMQGPYTLARDLAPVAGLLLLAACVLLLVFSATRTATLLVLAAALFGLPILLPPGKYQGNSKAYDPLLRLAADGLHANEVGSAQAGDLPTPRAAGESWQHHVSLSTPHRLFARIRRLDLTPLIRVELNPKLRLPPPLPATLHRPDLTHLKGGKHILVNLVCGPRLLLRVAKYVVGSSALRKVGRMTGSQLLRLLIPGDRYNFVLAQQPLRIVLSHVGEGDIGGMYAKHALLAELGRVVFAGELWKDDAGVVHINNASGTYQPEAELLPRVRDFMHDALQVQVNHHERTDKSK